MKAKTNFDYVPSTNGASMNGMLHMSNTNDMLGVVLPQLSTNKMLNMGNMGVSCMYLLILWYWTIVVCILIPHFMYY